MKRKTNNGQLLVIREKCALELYYIDLFTFLDISICKEWVLSCWETLGFIVDVTLIYTNYINITFHGIGIPSCHTTKTCSMNSLD